MAETALGRRYRLRLAQLREGTLRRIIAADTADTQAFLDQVVPIMLASQRSVVHEADAYLSAEAGMATGTSTRPWGLDPSKLIGVRARRGDFLEDVYARNHRVDVSSFAERMAREVNTDITLADRAATFVHTEGDTRITGYRRMLSPGKNCALCIVASDRLYHKSDLRPIHAHCVTGDTLVSGPAHQVTRRWDQGEAIVIRTAAGNQLTITPNHPVLTTTGWLPAGQLRQGMDLLRRIDRHRPVGGVPNEGDVPTCIEDRFRACGVRGLVSVPFAAEDFHGDRGDGDVDVVLVDRDLRQGVFVNRAEPVHELALTAAGDGRVQLPALCPPHEFLMGALSAPNRGMRGCGLAAPFFRGEASHSDGSGPGRAAWGYASLPEASANDCASYAERLGEAQLRFPGQVALNEVLVNREPLPSASYPALGERPDQGTFADADEGRSLLRRVASQVLPDAIVDLRRVSGPHWVYNLHTPEGWYYAADLIVHNCGCTTQPIYNGSAQDWAKPSKALINDLYERAGSTSAHSLTRIRSADLPTVEIVESDLGPTLVAA